MINDFTAGMTTVYIPNNNRMKLPEIPGNIRAEMAKIPQKNKYIKDSDPSTGLNIVI